VTSLYQQDLAYIQAAAFGTLARGAALEIVRRLRAAELPIRRVVDVGCGAGPSTLVRKIETFRRIGELYRRVCEVHRVRVFDTPRLRRELASCGFKVETARAYGTQALSPRRRAFFATRIL
jgi:hypothetical protein